MILVCSICGGSHYTQNCPEYAKGDHVKDKPSLNLSRSSVPNGLLIMDTQQGSCVVTSQKFAKGTRFGPLLAQKSYVPIKNIPFPLILFAGPYYHQQDDYCNELQTLFGSSRNVYLDTRNETKCNWMIHVSLARVSNEQNLICYQENDEIYYTAVKDIELGDILRVWYSRNYATKIGASLLEASPYDTCNNILRSVSMDCGLEVEKGHNGFTIEEYGHASGTQGSAGSASSTGILSGGGSHSNNNIVAANGSCNTSGNMIPSMFHDHNLLPHSADTSGNSRAEIIDIDSNNNSSNFCPAPTTAVKCANGTPISTLTTYDKVSLPPIDSLMKTGSPKYASSTPSQQHTFEIDHLGTAVPSVTALQQHHPTNASDLVDDYFNSPPLVYSSHLGHHHSHLAQHQAHGQFQTFHHNQQHYCGTLEQEHVGTIHSPHHDSQDLRLSRDLYSSEQDHAMENDSHHLHHRHVQQHVTLASNLADYQCLPDDTLSPADLINISLGASDINITFDTAFSDGNAVNDLVGSGGAHHLLAYESTNDGVEGAFGDEAGFDLMTTTNSAGCIAGGSGVVAMEKLHNRFSSSSDSLITLTDASLGLSAVTPTPSVVSSVLGGPEIDVDKKYVCEVCLRKYMTKSNLDKHVRKHNLFLCVFCMKLFQQADELKEHECSERKSKTTYLHCPKCLKVLSNSWSLQRHMKIHKDLTQEEATPLGSGGMAEETGKLRAVVEGTGCSTIKEPTTYDDLSNSAPIEELKPSIDSFEGAETMTLISAESDATNDIHEAEVFSSRREQHSLTDSEIKKEHPPLKTTTASPVSPLAGPSSISGVPNHTSIQITNTSSSQDMLTNVQAPNGKQLYKCIVCAKLFKNPNALEKHLRKVHTVYTVSNDYKSEKKVLNQLNQKKTSPIKPAIAKALATKLSQKSKKQEEMAAAAAAVAAAAACGGAEQRSEGNLPTSTACALQNQPRKVAATTTSISGTEHGTMVCHPRPYTKKKSAGGNNNDSGHSNTLSGSAANAKQTNHIISTNSAIALASTRTDQWLAHDSKESSGGPHNVTAVVNGGSASASSSTPGKSHSIIIISNLELTNNNLIDTSQLFLNQGTSHHGGAAKNNGVNALCNKIDVKVLNSSDKLPKLVPISNHHRHHSHQQQQQQHHQHVVATATGGTTLQLSGTGMAIPSPGATVHKTSSASFTETGIHSATTTLVPSKADDGSAESIMLVDRDSFISGTIDNIAHAPSSPLVESDSPALTLSPMKLADSTGSVAEAGSVLEDVHDKPQPIETRNATISHVELSNDNDYATTIDESNDAQLLQTFPCDECDRIFAKNYQLKRHMEIHDSVYYTCPYCDRLPLKAKASLRKHLYNTHPEHAPPKEQMNKFISTLVVTDENVLRELAIKNERKIRNKSAKLQAKQGQQHQQQLQQRQQQLRKQHPQELREKLSSPSSSENFPQRSPDPVGTATSGIIMYENGLSEPMLGEQGEDMLSFKTIFPPGEGSIGESSMDQMDHAALENCDQSSTCSSNTTNHGPIVGVEEKKRKAANDYREHHFQQQQMQTAHSHIAGCGYLGANSNSIDGGLVVADGKRLKILNASSGSGSGRGSQRLNSTVTSEIPTIGVDGNDASRENTLVTTRYTASRSTLSSNGTGTALRYLRKNQCPYGSMGVTTTASSSSMEVTVPSASSSMSLMTHNGHQPHHNQHHHHVTSTNALDGSGQLNLDSLFGNISIDNYEFDDNATIQSFSLIEEKFKTSFDQIQEKLDAELPFDEEQIKWQNNIMANDSSSEIGDKLLTGEENMMLI